MKNLLRALLACLLILSQVLSEATIESSKPEIKQQTQQLDQTAQQKADVIDVLLEELDRPVIVVVKEEEKENSAKTELLEDDAVVVKIEDKEKGLDDSSEKRPQANEGVPPEQSKTSEKVEPQVSDDNVKKVQKSAEDQIKEQKLRQYLREKLKLRLAKSPTLRLILRRRKELLNRLRMEAEKKSSEESNLHENKKEETKNEELKPEVIEAAETEKEKVEEVQNTDEVEKVVDKKDETLSSETASNEKQPDAEGKQSESGSIESKEQVDSLPKTEVEEPVKDDEPSSDENKETEEAAGSSLETVTPPPTAQVDESTQGTGLEVIDKQKEDEKKEDSDETNVKLEVDSIQSFEEWKKKHLQEKKHTELLENQMQGQRPVKTKSQRLMKTQVNYASQDCGSKILSSNAEAEHVSAVLDENKDLYMLNPCSAKIWFVVELCEVIQVRQLQLANFELFSSAPKEFDVSISERFPAREWRHLGTFEAGNTRALQTFTPDGEETMFTKYVKFEMKSHFGKEHYCPISIVRVLGISMVEEYEDSEDSSDNNQVHNEKQSETAASDQSSENNEADQNNESDENSEEEQGEKKNPSGINKIINIVVDVANNILGNGKNGDQNDNGELNKSQSVNATVENPSTENQKTVVEVTSEITDNSTTVVAGSEMEQSEPSEMTGNIVTVISTGGDERLYVIPASTPPLHPLRFLSHTYNHGGPTSMLSTQICLFLEYIYRASIIRCTMSPHYNQTSCSDSFAYHHGDHANDVTIDTVSSNEQQQQNNTAASVVAPPKINETEAPQEKTITTQETENNQNKPTEKTGSDDVKQITSPTDDVGPSLISPEDGLRGGLVAPIPHDKDHPAINIEPNPPSSGSNKPAATPDKVKSDDGATQRDAGKSKDDKTAHKQVAADEKKVTDDQQKPHTPNNANPDAKISKEAKKPVEENNKTKQQQENVPPTPKQTEQQHKTDSKVNRNENKDNNNNNNHKSSKEHRGGSKTADKEDHNNEKPHVINPGAMNQKESVLMRLSNRIRSLEKNMSLSSAYLEELSNLYKKQMDEMKRAFNRTTTRLAAGARKVEENEEKQQHAIDLVQRETSELREMLFEMHESMDFINSQMITRHLCLMAIEIFLLILFVYTCWSSRIKRTNRRIQQLEEKINQIQEYMLTNELKYIKPSHRLYRSSSNADTLSTCHKKDRNNRRYDDDASGGSGGSSPLSQQQISRYYSSPDLISAISEAEEATTGDDLAEKRSCAKKQQQRDAADKSAAGEKQAKVRNRKSKRVSMALEPDSNNQVAYKSSSSVNSSPKRRIIYNNNNPELVYSNGKYGSPWLDSHGVLSGKAR